MKHIALVIQRYGEEINGGAELLTRQWAERLIPYYDVEVLTTKAVDHQTWEDYYPNDMEVLNGVRIRRFSVEHPRDIDCFSEQLRIAKQANLCLTNDMEWIEAQGPYVPELVSFLQDYQDQYDAFIFCTYLYYPTAIGVLSVREKAILVPFAHQEPYIHMKLFQDVFHAPKAFLFETEEEHDLVRNLFHNYDIPFRYAGAGIEVPEGTSADRFHQKYGIDNYIIYVGRIEDGKNCRELLQFFIDYKAKRLDDLKLVLMGKSLIDIPEREDICPLGFVPEEDKFDGIAGAKCLILPSKFESLSLVVLEAFSLGVPVIVNGTSDVLRGHCERSGAGYYYHTQQEFENALEQLLQDDTLRINMGASGSKYVRENYRWERIIDNICAMIEYVSEKK